MADRDVAFLRLPADMKRQLQQAAKQNGRSLNAEIVYRLKISFGYTR